MTSLYIIGGGRWARVVAGEAHKLVDYSLDITIVSKKNFDGMTEWSTDFFGKKAITVIKNLPEKLNIKSSIYVANETKLRFETLQRIAKFKVPILVEKPLMLNSAQAKKIFDLYKHEDVKLSTSQVFRFLDSIQILKNELRFFKFENIEFYWHDCLHEVRYGELKKFEPDVPLHHNVFPHIYSIMYELLGKFELELVGIQTNELSETLTLDFIIDSSVKFKTHLLRSATQRLRLIRFSNESKTINFNFSSEESIEIIADGIPFMNLNLGLSLSLQNMLRAFIESNKSDFVDVRLDAKRSFESLQICEDIDWKVLNFGS